RALERRRRDLRAMASFAQGASGGRAHSRVRLRVVERADEGVGDRAAATFRERFDDLPANGPERLELEPREERITDRLVASLGEDRAEMLRRAKPPDHVGIARELIDPGAQRLVVIELHEEVDAPPIEADEARPNRHIERERLLRLRHLDRLDPRLASREVDSD